MGRNVRDVAGNPDPVENIPANSGTVGATAGWTTNNNTGTVKLPASQTASTFVVPVNLKKGTVIKEYYLNGQIESAGNTATLDCDLRYTTAAAADLTDASVGAITQISKAADYAISDSKLSLSKEVLADESYYFLLTGTTAALTDIDFQGFEIVYDENTIGRSD